MENKKINFKNYKKEIIIAIISILFLVLIYTIFNSKINYIDELVTSYVLSIRNDKLTNIMTIITNISSAYSLIVITILLFFILKKKKISILILINLISIFLTSQIFKLIFRRSRPELINLVEASGYSYPSGHASVSIAFFGFIYYLIYKNLNSKLLRILLSIITFILLLLICFSRIYLGVHYLSDILGGILLSICYLIIYIKILNKKELI